MENLVEKALKALQKELNITYEWDITTQQRKLPYDGLLTIWINDKAIKFTVVLKRNIRNIHLPRLYEIAKTQKNFMLITDVYYPNIFEKLKEKNIAYLDIAGNAYMKTPNKLILIQGKKENRQQKDHGNIFTPIGVKFVFHLLNDDAFNEMTYRDMAKICDTALGNIAKIINNLEMHNLIIKGNDRIIINDKKELFDKWVDAYGKILKPNLKIGTYKFLDENTNFNWNKIILHHGTVWGGEPAANIRTQYLKPALFTLYTKENTGEFIKNYRILPDDKGNIEVFEKFWVKNDYELNNNDQVTPDILTYADLIAGEESRNIETANIIYDRYLKQKFQ
jgi:hypothetical protein